MKEWYLNQEMKENKYYDIMEEPKVDINEKDFLENAEKEKKELEECYREALRQTNVRKNKWKVYQVGEQEDVVKNTIEPRKRKKGKMEEEAKKAERDLEKKLEILKKYNKKETKSVKKIFIALFLLGALGYIVNFLMGFF